MPGTSPATRRLVWLTAAITATILIIGSVTLWQTIGARASSDQIRRSAEVAACRSELRAEIDLVAARINDVFLSGLVAVAADDDAQLARAVAHAPDLLAEAREVTDAYAAGVRLSRTDPDRFIRDCRDR